MQPLSSYHSLFRLIVYTFPALLGIAFYMLTGSPFALSIPFLFAFIIYVIANWQHAYFLLLFCIPLSIQFSLQKDALTISLPDEPLLWLFMLLGMFLLAAKQIKLPAWFLNDKLVHIVLLQLLWLIVATSCSRVPLFSLKFLAAKCWYLMGFFVLPVFIFKNSKAWVTAFKCLLYPLIVTVIIIISRHSFYAFSFSKIKPAVGNLYINHVEYASVLSMFLPLIWVAYFMVLKANKVLKSLLFNILLLFIVAIILSYARAALLGLVFAALVGMAIKYKKVQYVLPSLYIIITLVLVVLISTSAYRQLKPSYDKTYFRKDYSDHLLATINKQDESAMERLYRWIAAMRMSTDEPLTGFGPHAFYYYYKPYTIAAFKTPASKNIEHSTTHNYFLLMLAEQGWPAMLLYALLSIVMFTKAQRVYHAFNDVFYKYCTLGVTLLLAVNFVNNFFSELIETHKVGALFYLALAALVILDQKSKEYASP